MKATRAPTGIRAVLQMWLIANNQAAVSAFPGRELMNGDCFIRK